jgi:hypothetical protein
LTQLSKETELIVCMYIHIKRDLLFIYLFDGTRGRD